MTGLLELDKELFLFLNGLHVQILDPVMWTLSSVLVWIPFYLFMIFLIYRKYGKKSILLVFAIILCFALADQISYQLKHLVMRPRPTHDPDIQAMVYTLKGYSGGAYGFVSSHAANTFGFAVLVSLLLKKKPWTITLFVWTMAVSYSRIYLGVHFPLDILGGWILGASIAMLLYFAIQKLLLKKSAV